MTSSNITDILPCPDKKGCVDVYADGELVLTISEDALLQSEIKVGQILDSQRLCEIEYSVALTKARAKAYSYLSYGDLSRSVLVKKLVRYGIAEDIADAVCDGLEQSGYIDDARYAASLAAYLANTKLYGPRRILQELSVKGISRETANDALDGLDTDFEQSIQTLVSGKFRRDLTDKKEVAKLFSALVRYGYDYDMIGSALSATEEDYE